VAVVFSSSGGSGGNCGTFNSVLTILKSARTYTRLYVIVNKVNIANLRFYQLTKLFSS